MTTRYDVISDPTASNWLKDCLKTSSQRDTVDLLNDLEVLSQIITAESLEHSQYLEHQINQIKNMVDFETLECGL